MYKSTSTIKLLTLFAAIFFSNAANASAQGADKRVEEIRMLEIVTNSQIVLMEGKMELSSIFAIELTVNKYLSPYPAVGIYQSTATFYYTYGDREKNPYPDRLLKVTVEYRRSSRTEKGEFYFNAAGQLVFALVTNEEGEVKESRAYFAAGRMIKLTDDGKEIGLKRPRAVEVAFLAKAEAARLAGIFRASLREVN